MNIDVLKQKRNYYNKNKIPYVIILDNIHRINSDDDFVFWDDANESVTVIRKNSRRGQGTYVAEELSSSYDVIQHIYAKHTLANLEEYLKAILPAGTYTQTQLDAVMTYMREISRDEAYIQDLDHRYTDKFDKKEQLSDAGLYPFPRKEDSAGR